MENSKELLYRNKNIIGTNISRLLKKEGYTKASFAKKACISRPTLDKILDGNIPSSTTLENHIKKIIEVLNVDIETLLRNEPPQVHQSSLYPLYSDNLSQNYKRSKIVDEKLQLLEGILDLCEIYYK